jgi:hypothetical protein
MDCVFGETVARREPVDVASRDALERAAEG